jgi:hypothetical protein
MVLKKNSFSPHFSYFPMILRSDFFYQFQIQNLGVTFLSSFEDGGTERAA